MTIELQRIVHDALNQPEPKAALARCGIRRIALATESFEGQAGMVIYLVVSPARYEDIRLAPANHYPMWLVDAYGTIIDALEEHLDELHFALNEALGAAWLIMKHDEQTAQGFSRWITNGYLHIPYSDLAESLRTASNEEEFGESERQEFAQTVEQKLHPEVSDANAWLMSILTVATWWDELGYGPWIQPTVLPDTDWPTGEQLAKAVQITRLGFNICSEDAVAAQVEEIQQHLRGSMTMIKIPGAAS